MGCVNAWIVAAGCCVYTVHLSSTLNRSSEISRFKHRDTKYETEQERIEPAKPAREHATT